MGRAESKGVNFLVKGETRICMGNLAWPKQIAFLRRQDGGPIGSASSKKFSWTNRRDRWPLCLEGACAGRSVLLL